MGAGLGGGPLTGGSLGATSVVAPAGQSAVVVGPLGAGATDIVTKAGTSIPEASVNANASLFVVAAGIGGTEVDHAAFTNAGLAAGFTLKGSGTTGSLAINNSIGSRLIFGSNTLTVDGTSIGVVTGGGTGLSRFVGLGTLGVGAVSIPDATGTPGSVTQNSPRGRAALLAANTSVTITNSECTVNSVVHVIWESDPTATRFWVVPGAGSFVLTVAAAPAGSVNFRYFIVQ